MIESNGRGFFMVADNHAMIQSPEDGAQALIMSMIRVALEDIERAMRIPLRAERKNHKARISDKARKTLIRADAESAAAFLDGDAIRICEGLGFHGLPRFLRAHCRRLARYRAEVETTLQTLN